ncbi:sigma-54-dependent Fis family transcriptional regulator [bacterium]|nr:sigma-54-dependent Fis family transcriptional regulator [bacterium]
MPDRLHVLLVDDHRDFINDFEALSRDVFTMENAESGEEALRILKNGVFDSVLLDLRLGQGIDGIETLRRIRRIQPDLPVIMITEFASVETAVEAMKLGAFHYMSKHPNILTLKAIIERELSAARWKRIFIREMESKYGRIIGESEAMKRVRAMILRVAPTSAAVLIEGENGTGKELVAREIHIHSGRSEGPYITVNCAAIPPSLFESECFGHERGAFTGAVGRHIGRFEQADGGTIFLDEIGCMNPDMQAKMLRVLENKTLTRVGGTQSLRVDIRIVAASNRILTEEIAAGRFREDLYHRLNVITIQIPPLRERPADIPILAEHFAGLFRPDAGEKTRHFRPETIRMLKNYAWPGNVRELRNVVERSVILASGFPIGAEELRLDHHPVEKSSVFADLLGLEYKKARKAALERFKKDYLSDLMSRSGGNVTQAAEKAGLPRTSLQRMLSGKGG